MRRRAAEAVSLHGQSAQCAGVHDHWVPGGGWRLGNSIDGVQADFYRVPYAQMNLTDVFAQALLEDCGGALSTDAKSYAEKIARSAQRMDHLTQDLLTYTRVSRQGVPLKGTASKKTPLRVGLTFNLKRVSAKSADDDDSHAEYDSPTTINAMSR